MGGALIDSGFGFSKEILSICLNADFFSVI